MPAQVRDVCALDREIRSLLRRIGDDTIRLADARRELTNYSAVAALRGQVHEYAGNNFFDSDPVQSFIKSAVIAQLHSIEEAEARCRADITDLETALAMNESKLSSLRELRTRTEG